MVQIDWDRIRAVKAVSLTDDEIEDLFPMVLQCDVEDIDSVHNFRAIIKLSQEMLQYKDNQVESFQLENDELKEKLSSVMSSSKKSSKLKTKEEESDESKNENSYPPEEYENFLRRKNEKIKNLMQELETLEKENLEVKEKLENLREEMEDTTESMNAMTDELTELRDQNITYKNELNDLKQEKMALINQIEEMAVQQVDRDKIIDEFGTAIDVRVTEWKEILDSRDSEILHLKNQLSQALHHPSASNKVHDTSEIVYLNDEIDKRDEIILDLESKLLEASSELNHSAELIEKLKIDWKKMEKSGKRKEQRELLKKIQEANEKISSLQFSFNEAENQLTIKSQELCDTLINLKKFENKDQGLAETISELKEIKKQLGNKNKHIQDLVDVVNKLEALNSQQEMQIITLREKLGMPEEEIISTDAIAVRQQKELKIRDELIRRNKLLEQENLELKSDVRILKYKLSKLGEESVADTKAIENFDWTPDQEIQFLRRKVEQEQLDENMRMVIDENEALRKGMHEILDSIHDQDGSSTVEVQSGTLEKLLEALDVRHLAGWYHPAMRLQERLNVIQGSNAELRAQLKQMRKDIEKKDSLLRRLIAKNELKIAKDSEESDDHESTAPSKTMDNLEAAYQNELEEWQQERATLTTENQSLNLINEQLTTQLETLESSLKAIEQGDESISQALASLTQKHTKLSLTLLSTTRKCSTIEKLLSEESSKLYQVEKDTIAFESTYKKRLADVEKLNKTLENRVQMLQTTLTNSVNSQQYIELKKQFTEVNLRLREVYEWQLTMGNIDESKITRDQSESISEKGQISLGEVPNDSNHEKRTPTNLHETNKKLNQQLIELQTLISSNYLEFSLQHPEQDRTPSDQTEKLIELQIENENLRQSLEISREEAQMYYTINSQQTLELDTLRHQILDLQAISEDKETIARLGFELTTSKRAEMKINRQKHQLETEISNLQNQLSTADEKAEKLRSQLEDFRRYSEGREKKYEEVLNFMQIQYFGSTPITSLERFIRMKSAILSKLSTTECQLRAAEEANKRAQLNQEVITHRLEIVDRLKEILEDQIGDPEVEKLMNRFSEYSQNSLNEYRLKRSISALENELQATRQRLTDCETTIRNMEEEIFNVQRAWRKKGDPVISMREEKVPIDVEIRAEVEKKSVSTLTQIETRSIEVQSDSYDAKLPETQPIPEKTSIPAADPVSAVIQDQLNQALALASDRSAKLIKCESQLAEYEAKIVVLDRALSEKDVQLANLEKLPPKLDPHDPEATPDRVALKSTITSLQKLVSQKEETISRYQNLLKEDRDEHSRAAERLQEEIRTLREEMSILREKPLEKINPTATEAPERDGMPQKNLETPRRAIPRREPRVDLESEEKIARLQEEVSTLEAELQISNDLSERWRRLAEERLQHMDATRERLEAQHKTELESYRMEMDKWKQETGGLRQQLSENRMKLAAGNICLSKELQERDNRIADLTMTCRQLQNELELVESTAQSHRQSVQSSCISKTQEMTLRESPGQVQSELDLLRRQHKSILEKEKMYKEQISDLKQQLSRRYMAEKTEEKKTSLREAQLEKKLKNLEEELNKARIQLDRDYRMQEAKRLKTAEELLLWEKQKKWQQTAEKLKKDLKDKCDEYKRLSTSFDKLKGVVSSMEREKWYLRSKIRSENSSGMSGRSDYNVKIIEDLQRECQTLRDRIGELTERLESEDNRELIVQLEKQKRRISVLEAVTEGNSFVVEQLEKLESVKSELEKTNIRLESENFELRMELEKANLDTPRLREKVEHLEKYVELLKVEKTSESSPTFDEHQPEHDHNSKKSVIELERTIFVLKRIVEKLQVENKRLRVHSKPFNRSTSMSPMSTSRLCMVEGAGSFRKQYEEAKKRVIALEADLQLAEQRIRMLEAAQKDEDNLGEVAMLKQQLAHKSELLDKVKTLLTRAAINEKALRQRIQQIELKQTLSTIPESPPVLNQVI